MAYKYLVIFKDDTYEIGFASTKKLAFKYVRIFKQHVETKENPATLIRIFKTDGYGNKI